MRRTWIRRKSKLKKGHGKKNKSEKPKEKGVAWYKKELWRWFSSAIRNRDKHTCITCGKYAIGGGCHAGHYIPKSVGGLRLYFDERNVNAQCYRCNINLSGNSDIYNQKLVEKYGPEIIEEFRSMRREAEVNPTKWSVDDYKEKIAHYKKIVKEYDASSKQ